jgi:hypothetical protein
MYGFAVRLVELGRIFRASWAVSCGQSWPPFDEVLSRMERRKQGPSALSREQFGSDCQWGMLPESFPKWRTVRSSFAKWSEPGQDGVGVLDRSLKNQVSGARVKHGRNFMTSFLMVDAESVKNADSAEHKGKPFRLISYWKRVSVDKTPPLSYFAV